MDRHTLEKKLKRIDNELLALKTAHRRGLGTFLFYEYTFNYSNETSRTWTAPILSGEPERPFVQASFEQDDVALALAWAYSTDSSVVVRLETAKWEPASGTIHVTCSSRLGAFS